MTQTVPKPVMLLVLDGWGIAPPGPDNAAYMANTPVLDRLYQTCPHTELQAHGRAVVMALNLFSIIDPWGSEPQRKPEREVRDVCT